MPQKSIYNLQFPSWCSEINIYGYRFYRVEDYKNQLQQLQHIASFWSEFDIKNNTGKHAITAYVDIPKKEKSAILEWGDAKHTALNDILLLLSLFTGREVFVKEKYTENLGAIMIDPRIHQFGGALLTSIPYKGRTTNDDEYEFDIGFEEELNRIYLLIRSDEWQKIYHRGYFLFLAKQAFHRQPLESSFIQCWTIWEHLFAILNQKWLSKKEIQDLSSVEKISFLLVEYALRGEIDDLSRKHIVKLAEIRNRLVHFGRFPDRDKVRDDAILFIRLTEFILAKILGLLPSNIFNTVENLEKYLTTKTLSSRKI